MVALIISVAAALLALASFLVAWKQLRVARTDAGGYGLMVNAYATGVASGPDKSALETGLVVNVSAAGPGVWHSMRLYVCNSERPVRVIDRYDSSCDAIKWEAKVPLGVEHTAWWMVTWVKPHLEGNRTEALRCRFTGDGPLERWKWKQPYRLHYWFQNERRWWAPGSGRQKPLGKWKPQPARPPERAQCPNIPKVHSWPNE